MEGVRRMAVAAWLAFVLVLGQQRVALHDLAHAHERIHQRDGVPAAKCSVHFACSQLASAVGAKPPPAVPLSFAVQAAPDSGGLPTGAAPTFVFLSRGPPGISA
ncbi:MAG TPA: hypothetical protein VFE23_05365 [Usitatibacter sp.]|jgi:hypothetical protein|nr:hypothetical protein [Usitatibacter sp.]